MIRNAVAGNHDLGRITKVKDIVQSSSAAIVLSFWKNDGIDLSTLSKILSQDYCIYIIVFVDESGQKIER